MSENWPLLLIVLMGVGLAIWKLLEHFLVGPDPDLRADDDRPHGDPGGWKP